MTGDRLRVVVCEPYYTGSHRSWADGLAAHSRHDIRLVTHTGGFWKWRMQGAALTLARAVRDTVAGWGRPDVLVASDMVHLPALLGFLRGDLAGVPVVLYLHENQLGYPTADGRSPDETYAMTNWLSVAVADRVVFNSEYHRRDLSSRLPALLRRFPDHRHDDALDDALARSEVVPIGIDTARFAGDRRTPGAPPLVLWNHRWEYDKDPATFFAALDAVDRAGVPFRLAVAGESFQTVPDEFERAHARFGDHIVQFGTASDEEYPGLLASSDVVVSTARHEFFGVAVAEAMAAGALPLLPNRLSYPELVPAPRPYLYGEGELVERLCWALTDHAGRRAAAAGSRAHVDRFGWRNVAPRYDALLEEVAGLARGGDR